MLIGYMRVSTVDERQSVDLQRDALLLAGVDDRHLHQDRASGARDDRLGLKACLADLRSGDVLVVWKLDRLGRSLSHLIRIITDLKERGIGFRSLTEQMDTTTPQGVLMFNLFGSLAEYERALIAERGSGLKPSEFPDPFKFRSLRRFGRPACHGLVQSFQKLLKRFAAS
ncbi:MAG: recombinase family protein [Pseudomonadota bacterium]|nr:recombinase family protein [Pseudomonadota bacterium]